RCQRRLLVLRHLPCWGDSPGWQRLAESKHKLQQLYLSPKTFTVQDCYGSVLRPRMALSIFAMGRRLPSIADWNGIIKQCFTCTDVDSVRAAQKLTPVQFLSNKAVKEFSLKRGGTASGGSTRPIFRFDLAFKVQKVKFKLTNSILTPTAMDKTEAETSGQLQAAEFGRPMLEQHFPHVARRGVLMLNNGSFGLTEEFESFADEFVRLRQVDLNYSSLEAIASRLRVRPQQCTLLENVTIGVSNILRRLLALEPRRLPGARQLLDLHRRQDGCHGGREAPEAKLQLPLKSGEDVLRAELTALCRSRGIKVIIDGAHAIGQVPNLDIEDIGADFYLGNLNKWHFLPKSVALMWISEAHVSTMKPDIVSWLLHDEVLPHRYSYLGTRDTSSFYVIPEALKFVDEICGGLDRVYEYCRSLADEASSYLAGFWGTDLLPLPAEMQAPFMRLIRLPQHLQRPAIKKFAEETRFESNMWKFVAYKLKMDLLILNIEDSLFIRIAASIVVDMNDIRLRSSDQDVASGDATDVASGDATRMSPAGRDQDVASGDATRMSPARQDVASDATSAGTRPGCRQKKTEKNKDHTLLRTPTPIAPIDDGDRNLAGLRTTRPDLVVIIGAATSSED
uniref:Aminotran_5 domain-containing protein n=1 Tax=Macrostomum lignano TaxID=282301 RepID=A0A1I8FNU1_9PLAT